MRDPGCGRRLLLRWDPALKCSGEQGQVHTAPCLPLPAARAVSPAAARCRTPPGPVPGEPHAHPAPLASTATKVPGRWGYGVIPPGVGRAGQSCPGTGGRLPGCWRRLRPAPPSLPVGWDGTGWMARSRSLRPGRTGPTPCGGDAGRWMCLGWVVGTAARRGRGAGMGPWCQHGAGGQGAGVGAWLGWSLLQVLALVLRLLPVPSLHPGILAPGRRSWAVALRPLLSADGGCARAALVVPGAWELPGWHRGHEEPGGHGSPGWCRGVGGSVYPLLSSNHFLSPPLAVFFFFLQRAFRFPGRLPSSTGTRHRPQHVPTSGPPAQLDPSPLLGG